MPIKDTDILDLLNTTRYAEKKNQFVDIAQEMNEYIVLPYLLKKQGGLIEKKGGIGIKETLFVDSGGRSRFIGEYDEDVTNVTDHLTKMQLNWTLLTDNVSYTRSELTENTGEARINDVILPRRRALWLRVAETMEDVFFQEPDADDDLTPWGLKYWIVKNTSEGFYGGAASGFTKVANVNLTEYPGFKNYTGTYSAVTKDDLIQKMRKAYRRTRWRSPKPMKQFKGDTSDRRVILCNEDTVMAFENVGEAQNENLGKDIAPMNAGRASGLMKTPEGDVMFKRHPIVYCEGLDTDTTDPVYGIDMATFHALTLKGDNMRMGDFKVKGDQHRVFTAHLDHKMQFMCNNRRNNFVLHNA